MKVSCIPICFFREMQDGQLSLAEWLDMAADIGLDGIEMYDKFLESFEPEYLRRVSKQVRERGLEISMFTGYGDLAQPEQDDPASDAANLRAEVIAEVKRNVDAALIMDTRIVRVVGGMWPESADRDRALTNVAVGLRECLTYAAHKGISLALEDHPEVGTKVEDFVEILKRVKTNDLKVNLDTSNPMVSGDDSVVLAKLVKSRTIHVHVSDRNADLTHVVLGEGVVDFPAIFRILREDGYDGWLSIEAGGTRGREGIVDSLDYLRRTWASACAVIR